MSDTPRTDKAEMTIDEVRCFLPDTAKVVSPDFARQLERELAEAREITEMQKETMRQMREQYGFGERNVMRELKQEIENLNKIIDAATNSANVSHLRAIEYQSQRDTLAEALRKCVLWAECMSMRCERDRENINWSYLIDARKSLAAVKGGNNG